MEAGPTPSDIPVIDFGLFLAPEATTEDKKEVAASLHAACRDVGFFYLKNHGVPMGLMRQMLDRALGFFEKATEDDKKRIALRRSTEGGDNARGWLRVENAEKGSHEAVDFYRPVPATVTNSNRCETGMGKNQWPDTPRDFEAVANAYIEQVENLGHVVLQALALGLGIDEHIFLDRTDEAFWNLRIIGYDGMSRKESAESKSGIGEHTDFGILTFLLTDATSQSLQVLNKDGEWIWADPIEGCYLCNIGDMLSMWTHGLYKSTLHRVVHTSASRRISVPFFFDPNWDAFISPVLPAPGSAGDAALQAGIRYSDKFKQAVEAPLWRDPLLAAT